MRFADSFFLATIMQHWLEAAKFNKSLNAMGYLIKCKHEKQVLAQFFCTMKIQSSKNKVIRTIDFRRQVLLVQDIFNALKDYKNRQNTKRELH